MDLPRLPQDETTYQVAMLVGANNEPDDHWETVGPKCHRIEDAIREQETWKTQFPDREWTVLKAVKRWEHIV